VGLLRGKHKRKPLFEADLPSARRLPPAGADYYRRYCSKSVPARDRTEIVRRWRQAGLTVPSH
jgi:hypothetical protein